MIAGWPLSSTFVFDADNGHVYYRSGSMPKTAAKTVTAEYRAPFVVPEKA